MDTQRFFLAIYETNKAASNNGILVLEALVSARTDSRDSVS